MEQERAAIAGTVPAHGRRRRATRADVVVVGAGAAGPYAALTAARAGARVALVSATPARARPPATGRRAGWPPRSRADDSPDLHRADTERAGRGLVPRERRRGAVPRGAARRARARARSACTSTPTADGDLALGLEGGHSRAARRPRRRQRDRPARRAPALGRRRRDAADRGARGRPRRRAVDRDGRCVGVVLRGRPRRSARARSILATGGAAALWPRTTNPPGALGIGLLLARARRRGARRPRAHAVPPDRGHRRPTGREGFLVTEAIRGEGATLLDAGGERFVEELAPRDEVARAIWRQMRRRGAADVDLDMRAVDPALFPNVVGALREAGLDPGHRAGARSPRRRTTAWAASSPTSTARTTRARASTRSARAPAPACTAPTGWPPTR